MRPAFIQDRPLFRHVYSSCSDIVALSLEYIMEASVAVRPGLVMNSVVIAGTRYKQILIGEARPQFDTWPLFAKIHVIHTKTLGL